MSDTVLVSILGPMSRKGKFPKQTVQQVEVVKRNPKTVWVRLEDGSLVKRHLRKHVMQ